MSKRTLLILFGLLLLAVLLNAIGTVLLEPWWLRRMYGVAYEDQTSNRVIAGHLIQALSYVVCALVCYIWARDRGWQFRPKHIGQFLLTAVGLFTAVVLVSVGCSVAGYSLGYHASMACGSPCASDVVQEFMRAE